MTKTKQNKTKHSACPFLRSSKSGMNILCWKEKISLLQEEGDALPESEACLLQKLADG